SPTSSRLELKRKQFPHMSPTIEICLEASPPLARGRIIEGESRGRSSRTTPRQTNLKRSSPSQIEAEDLVWMSLMTFAIHRDSLDCQPSVLRRFLPGSVRTPSPAVPCPALR
ncbi:hypothetical protein CHARACLAT_030892, partial [Characodon lateralis]|nr:hypothetical protein [Characodon lateralis]